MDQTNCLFPRGSLENSYYTDIISGSEGFTVVLQISGGEEEKLEVPFFIFKIKDRNYSINGAPDIFLGISYRTQPKAWMDRIRFNE